MSIFASKKSKFTNILRPFIILVVPLIVGGIFALSGAVSHYPNGIFYGTSNVIDSDAIVFFVYAFYMLISIIIAIGYGLHPALLTVEKLFIKRNTKLLFEYQFIKKFLIVVLPLLVLANLLFNIPFLQHFINSIPKSETNVTKIEEIINKSRIENNTLIVNKQNGDTTTYRPYPDITPILYIGLISYIVIGAVLRFVTLIAKENFRLYFARLCSKIILQTEDDFEKLKYLELLLDSYNKYLKRNLKIGIKDITKVYSIMINKEGKQRDDALKIICNHVMGDKLDLARYISTIYGVPDSEFYVKQSFLQNLKIVGVILSTAIPIVISVIATTFAIANYNPNSP